MNNGVITPKDSFSNELMYRLKTFTVPTHIPDADIVFLNEQGLSIVRYEAEGGDDNHIY